MESNCEGRQPCDDGRNYRADGIVMEFDGIVILWFIVNLLLMIFIIGGNLLTICAVRICRRLRAVISNLFILSLAVSDIIVGLTLPYHLAFYLNTDLGQSHTFCLFRFYIIIFACCISMWNMISIAVDRYIAIVYPLHYRRFMTRRVAIVIISIGWLVGTSLACIPVFWNHWQTAAACEFDQILPTWYMVGIVTPSFIIIWICMLLVYWRIWQEASKQAKQLRKATCCQSKDAPSDWKSVQVVLLIMGGFTICWLPYFIVACGQIFGSYNTSLNVYKGVLALAMANSGLNPIIYAWKNSNFRKSFGLLLRCKSPNCVNTSEYSVQNHCARNASPIQTPEATAIPCSTLATMQTQEPINTIVSSSPLPGNNPLLNTNVPDQLSVVQLLHRTEANRNQSLPILGMMAKESYMPLVILCSPCEICKFVLGRKTKLSDNLKATLIPWKCAEYYNHIINTLKCRW